MRKYLISARTFLSSSPPPPSPTVFLLGLGGRASARGPADLLAAAERDGQADVHLPLPELCRLAARGLPWPRARAALQGLRRGGADPREHAVREAAVRRMPSESLPRARHRLPRSPGSRLVMFGFTPVVVSPPPAAGTFWPGEDRVGDPRSRVQQPPPAGRRRRRFWKGEPEVWFPSRRRVLQRLARPRPQSFSRGRRATDSFHLQGNDVFRTHPVQKKTTTCIYEFVSPTILLP